jgi:hypothetical protein
MANPDSGEMSTIGCSQLRRAPGGGCSAFNRGRRGSSPGTGCAPRSAGASDIGGWR